MKYSLNLNLGKQSKCANLYQKKSLLSNPQLILIFINLRFKCQGIDFTFIH